MKKILTRPIWTWERNRSYPIRKRVWAQKPQPCVKDSTFHVVIAATEQTLNDAAWAVSSMLRQLPVNGGATVVADNIPTEIRQKFSQRFPGIQILDDKQIATETTGLLPHVDRLAAYHPMGCKLRAVLSAQRGRHVLFADADVLAFREMPEISRAVETLPSTGLFIQDDQCHEEPFIHEIGKKLGLKYHQRFSCGFMWIPADSLDLDLANRLVNTDVKITAWFPDTMVLAFLMDRAGATPLPKDTYIQNVQRQFYHEKDVNYGEIRVRHFVGPVRHLMYSRGMPYLERNHS